MYLYRIEVTAVIGLMHSAGAMRQLHQVGTRGMNVGPEGWLLQHYTVVKVVVPWA
jgi:hypothetical protein